MKLYNTHTGPVTKMVLVVDRHFDILGLNKNNTLLSGRFETQVSGAQVPGARFQVSGVQVPGVRGQVPGVRCQAAGVRCRVPCATLQVSGVR